uniref:VWFA domain-containing protein n=1 Tax=mine drainage metagenome TaxID=410659 RepID=E6PZQ2_9ZZZZ
MRNYLAKWTKSIAPQSAIAVILCAAAGRAALSQASNQPTPQVRTQHSILLDVTATDPNGKPDTTLNPFDFHILDNGAPQKLLAMQKGGLSLAGARPPMEMVIVLDAVNCSFVKMQLERQDVENFLHSRGGKLPIPTRIVILTDTKMDVLPEASQDGNALAKFIEQAPNPVHSLRFEAGYYGEMDRATWSLDHLSKLATLEARQPGRKLVIWISHGWHPLARDYLAMSKEDLERDFRMVETLTDGLLEARITLDSIDPILDLPGENLTYYRTFLKPPKRYEEADTPDLMLQVLATHSGGDVLQESTNIQGEIEQAMRAMDAWYTLAYTPSSPIEPNQFHAVSVNTGKDVVHAPMGYYSQPQ